MLNYIQKAIKAADKINFANQLILKEEDYPGLTGWAQYNPKGS